MKKIPENNENRILNIMKKLWKLQTNLIYIYIYNRLSLFLQQEIKF